MKKHLLISLILLSIINITLKAQIDYKSQYERKIERFTVMKNTGSTLTVVGIITTAAGAALIGSYISDIDNGNDEDLGPIMKMYGGAVCLELGIDMIIGGVVLNTIAKHKIRSYQTKLGKVSYNIILTPKVKGFGLTFRF